MTRDEVKLLLARIDATYPNFQITDPKTTVEAWLDIFAEYPYEVVLSGLKEYIMSDRKGFAPTPGQVIGMIVDKHKPQLTGMEAWGMVYKAICNSNYHAQEEYDRLPAVVQKAVGSPDNLREMASMSLDSMSVEQSHFLRVYGELAERERHENSFSFAALLESNERPVIEEKPRPRIVTNEVSPEKLDEYMTRFREAMKDV